MKGYRRSRKAAASNAYRATHDDTMPADDYVLAVAYYARRTKKYAKMVREAHATAKEMFASARGTFKRAMKARAEGASVVWVEGDLDHFRTLRRIAGSSLKLARSFERTLAADLVDLAKIKATKKIAAERAAKYKEIATS